MRDLGLDLLLVASAAGMQSDRFRSKEHPLDWGRLNASRGFCGMAKCYFPARLSEQEVKLRDSMEVAKRRRC